MVGLSVSGGTLTAPWKESESASVTGVATTFWMGTGLEPELRRRRRAVRRGEEGEGEGRRAAAGERGRKEGEEGSLSLEGDRTPEGRRPKSITSCKFKSWTI